LTNLLNSKAGITPSNSAKKMSYALQGRLKNILNKEKKFIKKYNSVRAARDLGVNPVTIKID